MKNTNKVVLNLNPQEAKFVSLFKRHGTINQFIALENGGIMRLAARVCDLKSKGAVIDSYKKDIQYGGVLHPRVAFYALKGWEAKA